MPANKNAFVRYLTIVRELKLASYQNPISGDSICDVIRDEIGTEISKSMIEKDIAFLRHDTTFGLFVPIKSKKSKGYYIDRDYSLSDSIRKTWRL